MEWLVRSPDLSPCDFFLWRYLKEKVFKHCPRSLEDLKERIQQEIDSISPELTRSVMKNFRERLKQCVVKKLFLMYFSEIYSILSYLYLFKMWEILMPHPVLTFH